MKNPVAAFDSVFKTDFGGLLVNVPEWVKKSVSRKIKSRKIALVSAVCPDYERKDHSISYDSIGEGIPYNVLQHLRVVEELQKECDREGVELEYHVSLADTEFDLPLVVAHMTNADSREFTRRCEASVTRIREYAQSRGVKLLSSSRFLSAFPDWFSQYGKAQEYLRRELKTNSSTRTDLEVTASSRRRLYQAMTGYHGSVNHEYCQDMVIRQWAQYMTWGECAEELYGSGFVLMNHTTPNLSRINDPFFRKGRERIPILQLSITTMPE